MKRSRFKRKKKEPDLHRKAWDVFSKWVRNRDKKCITCGSEVQLQGGHFFHGVLDFDEININAQCKGCNHFKSGNLAIYATYLINKHGIDAFQALDGRHWLAKKGEKREPQDYLDIIEKYTILEP